METIDLIPYWNRIANVWNEYLHSSKTHIAFKLKDRVPLGALNHKWINLSLNGDINPSILERDLSSNEDKYPVGINYNFDELKAIYPYKFHFNSLLSLKNKVNAHISYVTMPFMHKYSMLNVESHDEKYGVHVKNNKLAAFVEIPYDVYITALHIFSVSSSVPDKESLKAHPYITMDDVSKLEMPVEDVRIVKEKHVDLPLGFFGNVLSQKNINIIEVDDIYEYLTGIKLEQETLKLFQYE